MDIRNWLICPNRSNKPSNTETKKDKQKSSKRKPSSNQKKLPSKKIKKKNRKKEGESVDLNDNSDRDDRSEQELFCISETNEQIRDANQKIIFELPSFLFKGSQITKTKTMDEKSRLYPENIEDEDNHDTTTNDLEVDNLRDVNQDPKSACNNNHNTNNGSSISSVVPLQFIEISNCNNKVIPEIGKKKSQNTRKHKSKERKSKSDINEEIIWPE